ncbi:transmembrane protein 109 [Ictalurus punctatus]|uniref:Transmembrane protein 109 n=1 Tax=Ictalurus punctatus TaxID=7998 RepID=A0A2D0QME5_ICTPU|nr:transmembrane protein 109 [Ictalurus punctatus]
MAKFVVIMVFILSTLTRESVCTVSETASSMWQSAQSAVKSLGDDAHSYLVSLLGKQSVDTLQKTIGDAIKVTSQATANALNVVAAYITDFLGDAGIDAKLPVKRFTPEGVVFVAYWALLAVLGYWLLSLAVCLLTGVVRRTLFLLKVAFAIATFGLIVSDGGASAETTAMRLAALVFACVLLGVGPSTFRGDANARLEQKVKVLETRMREMERKRKEE